MDANEPESFLRSLFINLKENFAFVIAFFIAAGIINIDYFYRSNYHFDILPYISPAEIIGLAFLSIGKFSFASLIFQCLSVFFILGFILGPISRRLRHNIIDIDIGQDRISILPYIGIYPFFLVIFDFFMATSPSENRPWDLTLQDVTVPIQISTVIALFLSIVMVLGIIRNDGWIYLRLMKQYRLSNVLTIYVILQIISTIASQTKKEGWDARFKGKYAGTTIITASDTIVSDDSKTYIGRTSSAIFIYEFKSGLVNVLPASEVKMLKINAKE